MLRRRAEARASCQSVRASGCLRATPRKARAFPDRPRVPRAGPSVRLSTCLCSARSSRGARAYIALKDGAAVLDLRSRFHGHAFVNERGAQFCCSVEYAPCQALPRPLSKRDAREGTIEKGGSRLACLSFSLRRRGAGYCRRCPSITGMRIQSIIAK
jgi:Smg-4/UPF3 family